VTALGRVSALLAAAAAFACGHDRPAAERPSTSTAPSAAPEARAVCDSIAALWRTVAQTTVAIHDTIVEPVDRNAVDQARRDEIHPPRPACAVDVNNDSLMKRADSAAQPDHERFFVAPGWTELWMFEADGPDGSSQTFQRGLVRCQRHQEWDGGDDADSTYVPDPFYREHARCWRHDRPIIPSDTAHPGGL